MIHKHCETCIKPLKCDLNTYLNEKKGNILCPLIKCFNKDCNIIMHKCKQEEHLFICYYQKVKCLNCFSGCPLVLYRKDISKHLIHCSANVIHCTVEWNRWPLYTEERRSHHHIQQQIPQTLNIKHLDVALALRDQRMLSDLFSAQKKTQRALRNHLTLKYPAVPFKPYRGIHLTDSRDDACTREESSRETTNKLDFSTIVDSKLDFISTTIPVAPALPSKQSLSVDINVRTIACYQKKPKMMYTFRCAQDFRRDEYEFHYKNVHNDIHGGIDGWIEHRCPLWQYGCDFIHQRWNPLPKGSQIVFNEILESFGLKSQENGLKFNENQSISLSLLPFEILQNICRHLDGFSLNNLSLTSKRLRDVCRTFLETRGLVSLQWQRRVDEKGKYCWDIGYKKWYFSSAFTLITSWELDSFHGVTQHLKHCPHFICEPKTEPFKLPTDSNEKECKKHL